MARKRKRKIKKANITFVSLCGRGRNLMGVLYKGEDGVEFKSLIVKATEDGELTALVYVPDHADFDGDFASADVIKGLMDTHAENGHQLDMNHDCKPLGREKAFVAQSFIVIKGDPRFAGIKDEDGHSVNATGAWAMVIKLNDEGLRQKARTGELGGVSMFGRATFETIAKGDLPEENTMDEKQILALIEKALTDKGLTGTSMTDVAKSITADVIKGLKPEETSSDEFVAPAFTGEMTAENLRKHAVEIQKGRIAFELKTETDPAKIETMAKSLDALNGKDDKDPVKKGESSQSTGNDGTGSEQGDKLAKAQKRELNSLVFQAVDASGCTEEVAKARVLKLRPDLR